jgi:chromosome segregation ATPase
VELLREEVKKYKLFLAEVERQVDAEDELRAQERLQHQKDMEAVQTELANCEVACFDHQYERDKAEKQLAESKEQVARLQAELHSSRALEQSLARAQEEARLSRDAMVKLQEETSNHKLLHENLRKQLAEEQRAASAEKCKYLDLAARLEGQSSHAASLDKTLREREASIVAKEVSLDAKMAEMEKERKRLATLTEKGEELRAREQQLGQMVSLIAFPSPLHWTH